MIFALTDETYGLLTSIKEDKSLSRKHFYFYLAALNQSYWIFGTLLGSIIGLNIQFNTAGLEFSLTALFVVLCLEQYKNLKNIYPFLIGGSSALFSLCFVSSDKMLIASIVISIISLLVLKNRVISE